MKHVSFVLCALALSLCPALPLSAATQVANYNEAKSVMGADGVIFFAYADGWDAWSRQRCEQLMNDATIKKAARNAVFIPLPVSEQATDAQRQRWREITGGLNVPGASSYPALFFFNNKGQHYATLCGGELARAQTQDLAKLLQKRLEAGRKRAALEEQAAKTSGPEKAALLFRASQMEGLTWQKNGFVQQLSRLDPKDESGALRASRFNAYDFATGLENKDVKTALEEVERLLADKAYTDRQKQHICAAAIGVLRRKGNSKEVAAIRSYAERMQNYAPETPEGMAAAYAAREWTPTLRYPTGWNPSCVPLDDTPIELQGALPIGEAGTYKVTFNYTHGAWALTVLAVELYDGKTKVAEDCHEGFAGNMHRNNVYTLQVNKPVKEPHLFITTKMLQRDSAGKITIERQ